MKKGYFNNTKNLLLKNRSGGKVKNSFKYVEYLYQEYRFGKLIGDYLVFTDDDRAELIRNIKSELICGKNLDILFDVYPEQKKRIENASFHRDEKQYSYPVSKNFILVNSLSNIKMNQVEDKVSSFETFGLTINADSIISVEHEQIIFVENLEIMARINELKIPTCLQDALWLYRGDVQPHKQTSKAYEFFRRFVDTKHQLICFSDLDPDGIQIALTSGAQYWLTPVDSSLINMELEGTEQEWFNQIKAKEYLKNNKFLSEKCLQAIEFMNESRKTLQQEHMLAHQITLQLCPLLNDK